MEEQHPPYQYQRGKGGEDIWIRSLFFLSEKIHSLIKWRYHKISGGYGRVIYKQKKKPHPLLILVTGLLLGYLLWGPSHKDESRSPEIKEQGILSKLQGGEIPGETEAGEAEELPAWETPEADFQKWENEEDLLEDEPDGKPIDSRRRDEPVEDYPERRRRDTGYRDEEAGDGSPVPGEYETAPGFVYANYYHPYYDSHNRRRHDENDNDDKDGETGYGGERKKLYRSFQPPSRETESSAGGKSHGISKPKSPSFNPSPRAPKKIKEGKTGQSPGFSGGTENHRGPRRDSSFRNSRPSPRRPGSRPGNSGSSNRGSRSSFRSPGSSPRGSSSSTRSSGSSLRSSGSSSRSSSSSSFGSRSSSSTGSRSNPRKK